MRTRFRLSLLIASVLFAFPIFGVWAQANMTALENEFIRIVVNNGPQEAGRFSIDTTGGDPTRPTSKGQQLIYGGNLPWTSFTTVRIDGVDYVFGGQTARRAGLTANYGTLVSGPALADGVIATTYQYGDILVTQELSLVRGSSSRMLDTANIVYRISNQGKLPQQVGLRVMLDTKLGPNDGAPIRAGIQAITSATAIPAAELPAYWQAFDSLNNPTVISQGSLFGSNTAATKPDRVLFADWGTLADEVWEPTLDQRLGFHRKGEWDPETAAEDDDSELDTATALFWEPVMIDPGKSVSYSTYYGIGYVNVRGGQLALGITSPAETTFEYERTQPITVTGYMKNESDFEGRNVTFRLVLPEGLKLVGDSKAVTNLEAFTPGEELQASWQLVPTGKVSGMVAVKIEAASENMEPNATSWDIQVNVPKPRLVLSPNTQRVPLKTNKRPTMVPIKVNLTPAVEFYGIRLTLSYDPTVMKPLSPVSRGSAFVDDNRLLDGWTCDTAENGKIYICATRADAAPLTQAEINLATVTFRTLREGACPLTLENAVLITPKGEEIPVATSAGLVDVKTYPAP